MGKVCVRWMEVPVVPPRTHEMVIMDVLRTPQGHGHGDMDMETWPKATFMGVPGNLERWGREVLWRGTRSPPGDRESRAGERMGETREPWKYTGRAGHSEVPSSGNQHWTSVHLHAGVTGGQASKWQDLEMRLGKSTKQILKTAASGCIIHTDRRSAKVVQRFQTGWRYYPLWMVPGQAQSHVDPQSKRTECKGEGKITTEEPGDIPRYFKGKKEKEPNFPGEVVAEMQKDRTYCSSVTALLDSGGPEQFNIP
ncbi:hypothetical protein QBC44DRAFT_360426 [Cladorrhinum sp. PSN332]|nr:hypothetical protein QBC44DRAFT_360426 [Cladorrhinum sp. PSN332]